MRSPRGVHRPRAGLRGPTRPAVVAGANFRFWPPGSRRRGGADRGGESRGSRSPAWRPDGGPQVWSLDPCACGRRGRRGCCRGVSGSAVHRARRGGRGRSPGRELGFPDRQRAGLTMAVVPAGRRVHADASADATPARPPIRLVILGRHQPDSWASASAGSSPMSDRTDSGALWRRGRGHLPARLARHGDVRRPTSCRPRCTDDVRRTRGAGSWRAEARPTGCSSPTPSAGSRPTAAVVRRPHAAARVPRPGPRRRGRAPRGRPWPPGAGRALVGRGSGVAAGPSVLVAWAFYAVVVLDGPRCRWWAARSYAWLARSVAPARGPSAAALLLLFMTFLFIRCGRWPRAERWRDVGGPPWSSRPWARLPLTRLPEELEVFDQELTRDRLVRVLAPTRSASAVESSRSARWGRGPHPTWSVSSVFPCCWSRRRSAATLPLSVWVSSWCLGPSPSTATSSRPDHAPAGLSGRRPGQPWAHPSRRSWSLRSLPVSTSPLMRSPTRATAAVLHHDDAGVERAVSVRLVYRRLRWLSPSRGGWTGVQRSGRVPVGAGCRNDVAHACTPAAHRPTPRPRGCLVDDDGPSSRRLSRPRGPPPRSAPPLSSPGRQAQSAVIDAIRGMTWSPPGSLGFSDAGNLQVARRPAGGTGRRRWPPSPTWGAGTAGGRRQGRSCLPGVGACRQRPRSVPRRPVCARQGSTARYPDAFRHRQRRRQNDVAMRCRGHFRVGTGSGPERQTRALPVGHRTLVWLSRGVTPVCRRQRQRCSCPRVDRRRPRHGGVGPT